ncbi:MAG TPA: hypothetical protein DEV93_05160 [Chloroflexi bacterium]|nr:hypothetical protein [Chloroflexota bacterium]
MVKEVQSRGSSSRQPTREGDPMIKIEVTTALKDALEHAVASGTAQVALYKDKPVVILSYDEYERMYDEEEDAAV